jgi:hypothetical protein
MSQRSVPSYEIRLEDSQRLMAGDWIAPGATPAGHDSFLRASRNGS